MSCECVKRIETRYALQGKPGKVAKLRRDGEAQEYPAFMFHYDKDARAPQGGTILLPDYCPFCGVKYASEEVVAANANG